MTTDIDRHCNDLTQLCSREQLSALMDGALPEDQTRFLLRRLRHDAELAGCWERWRLAAEAMRGVVPSRRLAGDFASRVAVALQEDAPLAAAARAAARATRRRRWGGGAALAAALAALTIVVLPTNETAVNAPALEAATTPAAVGPAALLRASGQPVPQAPDPSAALPPAAAQEAGAALLVAAAARPDRRKATRREAGLRQAPAGTGIAPPAATEAATPAAFAVVTRPPEVGVRPWPRSAVPQFGRTGLTVGFGELPPHAVGTGAFFAAPTFAPLPKPAVDDQSADEVAPERSDVAPVHKANAATEPKSSL